ncbi:MAG: hypothetical protein Q9208_003419 [Pyrenodesmia sp. 3 TL-2023]
MAQVRLIFNRRSPTVSSSPHDQPPSEKRITRAQAKASETSPPTNSLEHVNPPVSETPSQNPRPRSKKPKKPFPFLDLPVETRVQIYHDALTYDHILIRKPKARKVANLLLLNRLIHSEAFPIFYDVNVFQVHIGGLPSDTETAIANVHYMRQCCLHLEILHKQSKSALISKLVNKFVADIWTGKMECLLVDIWEPAEWPSGTTYLEKLSWMRGIHLAQVVVNQVGAKGKVVRKQDRWCQRLERSMMSSKYSSKEPGDEYEATPRLGIDLVGEDLEKARKRGGWVLEDNDLYALFGKCSDVGGT